MSILLQFSAGMVGMVTTLVIAAWTDWTRWRVPNLLLGVSAAVALAQAAFLPYSISVPDCLLGGLTGLLLFLPFYLVRGMGAGDVKLLAVVGMYAGPLTTFKIALATALVGGLWGIVLVIRWKAGKATRQPKPRVRSEGAPPLRGVAGGLVIPYGVAMAIATSVLLFASAL